MFSHELGPDFTAAKFPAIAKLMEDVYTDAHAATAVKEHFKRARPCTTDPSLLPDNLKPESSYSYPSGHSTVGTVDALLLAELFPQKQKEILAEGKMIGWRRVEIARHYPSDIYAGRVLGQAIVRQLKTHEAFREEFERARQEAGAWSKSN